MVHRAVPGHDAGVFSRFPSTLLCLYPTLVLALVAGCAGDGEEPPQDAVSPASDAPDASDTAEDPGQVQDVPPDEGPLDTGPADEGPPPPAPVITLTINELPAAMNGSQPYLAAKPEATAFTLRVNRARFTLDVLADPEAGPVDWATLAVSCDGPLAGVEAGELLPLDRFEPRDAHHRALSPGEALEPAGTITCSASVDGPGGASQSELTFELATMPPKLDPFVTPDIWLIVLSRDIFAVTTAPGEDGGIAVLSEYLPAGNGTPDLEEALAVTGVYHPPVPEAAAWVRARLLKLLRQEAELIFEGVALTLVFEGDADAPDAADFTQGGFSMIAFGGDGKPPDIEAGTLGRAKVDWNNQKHEDDTEYGLGVFVTSAIRLVLGNPTGAALLAEFLPGVGTPFGEHPADATVIAPDYDPETSTDQAANTRYVLLTLVVDLAARGLASVLCHEIGHSLGLVPSGPPPLGLFAGVKTDFTGAVFSDAHVDTDGLNIMQTGSVTNILEAATLQPAFNPLVRAYLKRQVVIGSPDTPPGG